MNAPSDASPADRKAYFLSLETSPDGAGASLADVLSNLRFNEQGLLPVVTQDAATGDVLMLAWMNQDALEQTLSTGQMTYFSRSRNELWLKGETSGNFQWVEDARLDCDGDALLFRVRQQGSACHTGRRSCFYLEVNSGRNRVTVHGQANPPAVQGGEDLGL